MTSPLGQSRVIYTTQSREGTWQFFNTNKKKKTNKIKIKIKTKQPKNQEPFWIVLQDGKVPCGQGVMVCLQ